MSAARSRWDQEDPEEEAAIARRKREKEERKRAKAEKQRQLEAQSRAAADQQDRHAANGLAERPSKRRRLSEDAPQSEKSTEEVGGRRKLLEFPAPEWAPCRLADNYEMLNMIEEGAYGLVSRAKDMATGEFVALKKLKPGKGSYGFTDTGLREIQVLQRCRHPNIVRLREVVFDEYWSDLGARYVLTISPGISSVLSCSVFLVMDFIEHDLRTVLDDMPEPFLPSEAKSLLLQILSAVDYLHSHWIMHRDLKTVNVLLNNRGEIKIADFGMARFYGDPPPDLTQLVVTLWYRAPELLLGAEKYGPEIDMWSVGCIFAELLTCEPLFQGKDEVDQLSKVFAVTGPPNRHTWPNFRSLPNAKTLRLPPEPPSPPKTNPPLLPHSKFQYLTEAGLSLLSSLLALNPAARPTAAECLLHPYFKENPRPKPKEMFPTFPSKAGGERHRRRPTPAAPRYGDKAPRLDFGKVFTGASEGGEA